MLILFIISAILPQLQKDIHSIYSKVKGAEVSVHSFSNNVIATGTVVGKNTIVTSGPIGKGRIGITLDNRKKISGDVVGMDEYTGLTVITVKKNILKPPVMRGEIKKGDIILIIGNGYSKMGIDGIGFFKGYTDEGLGIIAMPMHSGSNGAGIYNINGELVGVLLGTMRNGIQIFDKKVVFNTHWVNDEGEGSVFIPINLLFQKINKIRKGGSIEKGWLGIKGEDIGGKGVKVTDVVDGSPAEDAGLGKGDIIKKVGHRDIRSMKQLRRIIENTAPGKVRKIYIDRGGKKIVKKVKIGTIPEKYKKIIINIPDFLQKVITPE